MLFYTILLTLLNVIAYLASIPTIITKFKTGNAGFIVSGVVITGAIILNMIIMVTIVLFFKFHLGMVFENQTTLETLELKRQGKDPDQEPSEFNIGTYRVNLGTYYNWVQVFGRSSCTWWLPIFLPNEGPAGDGVIWPKRPKT